MSVPVSILAECVQRYAKPEDISRLNQVAQPQESSDEESDGFLSSSDEEDAAGTADM